MIRELEQQSISQLEVDIDKELEATLQHRAEVQQNLTRQKIQTQRAKNNSSNFEKGS